MRRSPSRFFKGHFDCRRFLRRSRPSEPNLHSRSRFHGVTAATTIPVFPHQLFQVQIQFALRSWFRLLFLLHKWHQVLPCLMDGGGGGAEPPPCFLPRVKASSSPQWLIDRMTPPTSLLPQRQGNGTTQKARNPILPCSSSCLQIHLQVLRILPLNGYCICLLPILMALPSSSSGDLPLFPGPPHALSILLPDIRTPIRCIHAPGSRPAVPPSYLCPPAPSPSLGLTACGPR